MSVLNKLRAETGGAGVGQHFYYLRLPNNPPRDSEAPNNSQVL